MYTNPSATKIEDKGNPIGHYCKIVFRKSVNEKTGAQVRYPIRYGRSDGNSIWIEKEIIDLLVANFVSGDKWGGMFDSHASEVYKEWKTTVFWHQYIFFWFLLVSKYVAME